MAMNSKETVRSFPQIQQQLSQGYLKFGKPADLLISLIYCIPALAPTRVCIELGIFERLKKAAETNEADLTAEALAEILPWNTSSNIDRDAAVQQRRDYIVRMLRLVCAVGLIDEGQEPFTYRANALTLEMGDPAMAAGFLLVFDAVMGPKSTMSSLLPFSEDNSFCVPRDAEDGPFQRSRDIVGTSTFDHWVQQEPQQLSRLNAFMSRVQSDRPHWTQWFPRDRLLLQETITDPDERVFVVDVGGGLGHDLFALATTYPEPGLRFLLQDQSSVIEEGKTQRATKSVELDSRIALGSHDFFSPQPIQGATIYYMHKIMHDWSDADCVRILAHLRDAMAPDSRIFINEMIVPDRGATLL